MDTLNPKITDGWKDLKNTYTEDIWDSYVQFRYASIYLGPKFNIVNCTFSSST